LRAVNDCAERAVKLATNFKLAPTDDKAPWAETSGYKEEDD